ncbi:MAG: cell division protein FtsA [Pseudobdellovibrionaceae bacterium]
MATDKANSKHSFRGSASGDKNSPSTTSKMKKPVLAGLDIGTTKVTFVIATVESISDSKNDLSHKLSIVGLGNSVNTGLKQGVVVNIEATTEAIKRAKEEAELMSGYHIQDVWVSVSGTHIKSFDSKGMVAIKNREVTKSDIDRVIEAAKAVTVPSDREVLHVLPREYKVDSQDGITDPVGMTGIRLEANVHIVTAGQTALSNLMKCLNRAGLKKSGLVLDPLASSLAVLSQDEKNLGVGVVDMGGGSCHLLCYLNGSVAYTSHIPVGGSHFTHDVAIGLRTPQVAAEELKKKYGCALSSMVKEDETVEVEGVGGRKARLISRKDLSDVIEARAEEVMGLVYHDLSQHGILPMLGSGIVLTGGASILEGLSELGEYVFEVPVRRGQPQNVLGLTEVIKSPEYSTAVGLVLYAFEQNKEKLIIQMKESTSSDPFEDFPQKIKDFFGNIF